MAREAYVLRVRASASFAALSLLAILALAASCSGTDGGPLAPAAEAGAPTPGSSGASGGTVTPGEDGGPGGEVTPGEDGGSAGDGATPGNVPDPAKSGPFNTGSKAATATVASTGDSVAMRAVFPKDGGPSPVVVVAHGFQLEPTQYDSYLKRLASFGYVAITADYPAGITGSDNPRQAKDLIGAIDWAKDDPTVGPHVDATRVGMTGHSLGGKLALLAATMDPRVKAAIVLDPVDGGGGPLGCNAPSCVVVAPLLANLAIPTAFLGETLDATPTIPGGMACAPAASSYTTFFAKAKAPSLEVTVVGAGHMSFIDNPSCGFTCSACKTGTAKANDVEDLAQAYVVAFYERWLRGTTAYDAYLSGAMADARYVKTGRATINTR